MARPLAGWLAKALASSLAGSGGERRLLVLCYHRVLSELDPMRPTELLTEHFERQMRFLRTHFNVLSLSEALSRRFRGDLPKRAVCITFDDGYADNATNALPILQRYGLSATVFVASDFINGGRMWNDSVIESIRLMEAPELDLREFGLEHYQARTIEQRRETAYRIVSKLKYAAPGERQAKVDALTDIVGSDPPDDLMLSGEQLVGLVQGGIEIGAHTRRHPILTSVTDEEASAEICESKRILEQLIDRPVTLFAYPNGRPGKDYDVRHVRMVREAGYVGAVSTSHGSLQPGQDLFEIPRVAPWAEDTSRFGLRMAASYRA